VLTVGATEKRPAGRSGGYSSYYWGIACRARYPKEPLKTDLISYSATPVPEYRQGMAAFSSRGPTDDGRIKPEVVAPGTDVISTKSSVGGNVWASYAPNSRYCFGGGTSMATPLAAGAAALLRQYAAERAAITNPSAPLLKAMVVAARARARPRPVRQPPTALRRSPSPRPTRSKAGASRMSPAPCIPRADGAPV
jgi:subtilisin family serine protease